jgi:predicted permease
MIQLLRVLFAAILLAMLWLTVTAGLERGVFDAASDLWSDPWFKATLADAYFGFIAFFVWVAYKERSAAGKLIWFALLMALGNIAIAIYMLIQLSRLEAGDSLERLLLRDPA